MSSLEQEWSELLNVKKKKKKKEERAFGCLNGRCRIFNEGRKEGRKKR